MEFLDHAHPELLLQDSPRMSHPTQGSLTLWSSDLLFCGQGTPADQTHSAVRLGRLLHLLLFCFLGAGGGAQEYNKQINALPLHYLPNPESGYFLFWFCVLFVYCVLFQIVYFYFMCIGILLACVSVGIKSSFSGRAASALNHRAVLFCFVLLFCF